MESDVIIVQFVDKIGRFKSRDIQEYLDGENQWNLPINEQDIIKIDYAFSNALYGNKRAKNSAILLVHRRPCEDSQ